MIKRIPNTAKTTTMRTIKTIAVNVSFSDSSLDAELELFLVSVVIGRFGVVVDDVVVVSLET